MEDAITSLFGSRKTVTIGEIAAYFRVNWMTVIRRMRELDMPVDFKHGRQPSLTRAQTRKLFPDDQ